MSNGRKVSTDALETLGTIIDNTQKRDAIHIAVLPMVAAERLLPAQHIGLVEGGAGDSEKPLGIVDPFLPAPVRKGQVFWMLLYPRMVTSLRHVWSHPAFADVDGVIGGGAAGATRDKVAPMTNPNTPASPPLARCPECNGSGRSFVEEGWPDAICALCNGLGRVVQTASPPEPEGERCRDCLRPVARHYWDDEDEFCFATGSIASCVPKTIARLRSEVATLRASDSVPHPCAICSRPMILPPNGDTRCLACAVAAEKELATLRESSEQSAKLTDAERAVVEAALRFRNGFGGSEECLEQASDALLTERAKAGQ